MAGVAKGVRGWFRAGATKYTDNTPAVVLADLVGHTPGEESKWFAAAKDAKLFDEAVALARTLIATGAVEAPVVRLPHFCDTAEPARRTIS